MYRSVTSTAVCEPTALRTTSRTDLALPSDWPPGAASRLIRRVTYSARTGALSSRRLRPMRIVHIAANDARGGAALACWRLHHALREHGLDSRLLVHHKESTDDSVEVLVPGPIADLHGETSRDVITRVYCDNNRTSLTDTH